MQTRAANWALAAVGLFLIGAPCGGLKTILIDEPASGLLIDDPVPAVAAFARVGNNFDPASIEVRLDGVDLVQALALSPPFQDAAGVVSIGGALVAIDGFTYQTAGQPDFIELTASGFDTGAHTFEVAGFTQGGALVTRSVAFETLGPFSQAASVLAPAGLPDGPGDAGAEGVVANATLGQPLAAPPIGLADGGELRSGFVPAAEGAIAGGAP